MIDDDPRRTLRQEKDAYWLSLSPLERIKKTVEEQNAIARSKIFAASRQDQDHGALPHTPQGGKPP
ncbi:MAG: hypothetical protein LBS35_00060 [Synergistaceae bacterium]|jgi:hypothetical protein|nr:hypothetical protein [Synergistaceae bacterium]